MTVTTMFSRRICLVLMIVLSWTSSFQAQQPQTKAMVLARPRPVPVPNFTGKTLDEVRSQAVLPGVGGLLFSHSPFARQMSHCGSSKGDASGGGYREGWR